MPDVGAKLLCLYLVRRELTDVDLVKTLNLKMSLGLVKVVTPPRLSGVELVQWYRSQNPRFASSTPSRDYYLDDDRLLRTLTSPILKDYDDLPCARRLDFSGPKYYFDLTDPSFY